jgi:hypothetical protein
VDNRDNGDDNADNESNGDANAENESPSILLDNAPAMNTEADETAGVLREDALADDITVMTDAITGEPNTT